MEDALPTFTRILISELLPAVAAVAGTALSALIPLAADALRRKWDGEAQRGLIDRLEYAADLAVDELNQTIVPELKKKTADGRLSQTEVAQLKTLARQRTLILLGKTGSREASRHAGRDLDSLIDTVVEAQVGRKRAD